MSCQLDGSQTRKAKLKQNIRKGGGTLIPCVKWISSYSKLDAVGDFIAGLTIGLILIPQGVAYCAIVQLSAKGYQVLVQTAAKEKIWLLRYLSGSFSASYFEGLLSSLIGSIIYTFFGTIKEISMGPTAMMSLLTNEYTKNLSTDSIGLLCFGCGIVGLILSILRLGLIVEFISIPVSSAFGSAVAFTILASEIKNFLGLEYKSNLFTENIEQFIEHAHEVEYGDVSLGIVTIVTLVLLGKVKDLPISKTWKHRSTMKRILWFVAMSRNAITLFLACVLTYYFKTYHSIIPFKRTDDVTPGLPKIQVPWHESRNVTITLAQEVKMLCSGMIVIPIVALLVHVTIAKFFDSAHTVNVSHELISTSLSNLLCSFFNSSPIAGAFSRSAVSSVIQVRSPISNIYAAVVCLLALSYLTPYFRLIPKASLSAVIVTAIVAVIDYQIVIPLWKNSKKDLFILVLTLFVALYYGVEIGLIVGVFSNLLFLVYLWARPSIVIERCKCEFGDYAMVTPDLGLFFPAVSYLESEMNKTLKRDHFRNLPVAVNCLFFKGFDYTAVKGLTRIMKMYQKQKRPIIFFNANQKLSDMCSDVDDSVLPYICDNEENYKYLLFDNKGELKSVTISRLEKPKANGMNGDCAKDMADKSTKEEVPLLDIIKKQNRPNSL